MGLPVIVAAFARVPMVAQITPSPSLAPVMLAAEIGDGSRSISQSQTRIAITFNVVTALLVIVALCVFGLSNVTVSSDSKLIVSMHWL